MKSSECYQCQQSLTTRRDFMRVGTLGFLGLTLADFLRASSTQAFAATAPPAKAQSVILLWLEGGPSQVDTWDVKGNTSFKPISTNASGVQICEIFPKLARHMDKLSIIRSMKTQERNHPQATVETLTGHRQNPALKFPSFGSIVAKELGPQNNMPPFVVVPAPQENGFFAYADAFRASFLGPAYDAMVLTDPSKPGFKVPDLALPKTITPEEVEDGREMLKIVDRYYRQKEEIAEFAKMDTFEEQAMKMILSPTVKNAFDLTQEPDKMKDAYGRNRPGQSALLARRLVEAGCRFVTAAGYKANEWDTHSANEKHLKEDLAPLLDQTLSTLMEDLDQRGLLKTTVVLVAGEFGRTPVINPNGGRDHWPDCWSLLIGGGGIEGGQIIGASDKDGAYVADQPVSLGDLFATVYKAMGVDWTKTYNSPIGRPIYIANGFGDTAGAPLKELV
jgi:hypothetical protein